MTRTTACSRVRRRADRPGGGGGGDAPTVVADAQATALHADSDSAQARDDRGPRGVFNRPPDFVVEGSVRSTDYDGSSDDLLTAGLGKSGLASAAAPAFANARWRPPRPSCAASPSTTTTAPSST